MNHNLLNTLDIGKIVGNLNRVLDVANKAIPLFNQVKPIFKNASVLTNMLNIINTPDNDNIKTINEKNIEYKKNLIDNKIKKVSNNLPTFFQ